jgi:hypothetical protein
MRKYLVPVEGDGGNFLAGLVSAGVPDGVLWAPARALSKGNYMGFVILRDKLWLPTEREMLPKGDVNRNFFSQNGETVENQAWLEYYDDDYRPSLPAHPPKIGGETSNNFWEGSASTGDKFCIFDSSWCSIEAVATAVYGVVPAFCVQ